MRYAVLLVFLFGLGSEAKDPSCKSSPCIGVDLYYESLCPDSMMFVRNGLVPSYGDLKEHLDVNFVPYGKATHKRDESNKWVFTCQHGAAECQGNKAQACALDAIQSSENADSKQALSVALVGCVMSSNYPATAVQRCAETVGLSAEGKKKITDCEESTTGDDLLAGHGDKTYSLEPPVSFVPTVVINGVYSAENQKAAIENFKKLICDLLPTEGKPATCSNNN